MYICELCKKRMATIHLTDIQNNVKRELHICETCAEEKGLLFQSNLAVQQIIGGMEETKQTADTSSSPGTQPACEECGITWTEFRRKGRLGCPHDYEVFRPALESLLGEIHAPEARHRGKRPSESSGQRSLRRELMACQQDLRRAIQSEDYEQAAALRDQLDTLRQQAGHQS
jgi:protein arginine kinase activator